MRSLIALVSSLWVFVSSPALADDTTEPTSAAAPVAPVPVVEDAPIVLESVHVEARDGRERVVLSLSRPSSFRVVTESDGRVRMEVRDASIDVNDVVRTLPEGVVRNVSVSSAPGRAVITLEVAAGARGTAVRAGRRIFWVFEGVAVASGPRTRTVSREVDFGAAADAEESSPEVAAFLTDVPLQLDAATGRRRFAGRRVDLDFHEADIQNILRLLAEVGNVNIVTSDDVSGAVTIRMRNVPWDQALDVILQARGLGMVRRDNLIRVAPLERLQAEQEAATARLRDQYMATPLETRLVPVSYATASELAERVAELLTDRGTVSVDTRTNMLIVRDIAEQLNEVEELVRSLDTQTPQVLVEARIVEASSQYSRDVGIQWGGDATMSSNTGNPTGLVFPYNVGVAGGNSAGLNQGSTSGLSPTGNATVNPNYAVNLPAIVGQGQGGGIGLTMGSVGGNVNLSVRLTAAEANGTVRIISSPRILTLDNQEALIAQGTLIPYSQLSAQGVNTAFQQARLELRVRPHVTSDGSVSMHVHIKRDEPDFSRTSARGDPTILQREAETELLIPDGNTAVIGGIYTRNTGRNLNQIPFFGDIPVLGVLFQRRAVRDDRSELLIFLTPRIVNRAESLGR
jgi:type IV pilus assembly protein PilQ